jgi:hypothetical protein
VVVRAELAEQVGGLLSLRNEHQSYKRDRASRIFPSCLLVNRSQVERTHAMAEETEQQQMVDEQLYDGQGETEEAETEQERSDEDDPDKTQPEEALMEARESSGGADRVPAVASARVSSSSVVSSTSVASSVSASGLDRLKSEDVAPLAETTPEDIKNFCATQACAQPDDVVALAKTTLESLRELWSEIGLQEHECQNSTAEMFAEVKRVFEHKLSSTQEVKCSLISQIRLASARITTIERETGTTEAESQMKQCQVCVQPGATGCLRFPPLRVLFVTKNTRMQSNRNTRA